MAFWDNLKAVLIDKINDATCQYVLSLISELSIQLFSL